MERIFYIPIKSTTLAFYFAKALILPSSFFNNKPEDIQDRLPESILLSSNKWLKNTDCSIEVVLTENEIKSIKELSKYLFQLDTPIPISRIKKIFFLQKEQMDTTIWNINNGAAYVPKNLTSVDTVFSKDLIDEFINTKEITINSSIKDNEEKAKRFDIALGGFAFMKVGTEEFNGWSMNFPRNYFATFSFLNKLVEEQISDAEKKNGIKINKKFTGLFSKNDIEWAKWKNYIYKNIELNDVEKIALKEGEKIEKKLGLIDINKINKNNFLYDISILATYGDRKNKSIDDLVNNLHNGNIPTDKIEEISLLFGLNYGYSKLRNNYKTKTKQYEIKFKLESKLDYYIIESIYQFTFNNKRDNYTFSYLDNWLPTKQSNSEIHGFETYKVLDTVIIAKKKQTFSESFLENFSEDIYEKIANSIRQSFPFLKEIDKESAYNYYDKLLREDLIKVLQKAEENISQELYNKFGKQRQILESNYNNEITILKSENLKLQNELENLLSSKVNSESIEKINLKEDTNDKQVELIDIDYNLYYKKLNLTELKKIAQERGIKGLSKFTNKNRDELISLIINTPTIPL